MKNLKHNAIAIAVGMGLALPNAVMATNGMNVEGYGPIALGMGGASMAYDNGTAAVMNNPATLGLMEEGTQRVDGALGFLGPDISTKAVNDNPSSADAFYMPAVGWAKRDGQMSYGFGLFAQGGMGTEYSANSDLAMGTGDKVMSQVGVMRMIVPLTFKMNDKLTIGGSIDYVRASMDLKMAVDVAQLNGMVTNKTAAWDAQLAGLVGFGADWGRFDFDDDNDFSGATTGDGFGFKLGAVYQLSPELSFGATYHSETSISDLEGSARLSAGDNVTGELGHFDGTIAVRNFQWPSTYGIGMAYNGIKDWSIVADYKRINWSDVMDKFRMSFTTAAEGTLDVAMDQNWEDQDVFQIGAQHKLTETVDLRFGANIANNPVPNGTVNPLFPAIIEKHYTAGVGVGLSKTQTVNFAASYAPEVTVTNSNNNMTISHSQMSWQVMYSHGF